MTLLVMLLTTATAWAEDNVPYLDPTAPVGQQSKTQDNVTVLTGNEITSEGSPLQEGWYIVKGTINYSSTLYFSGDVKLILADEANVTIENTDDELDNGIKVEGSLNIYCQGAGSGTLTINASHYGINASGSITINGANVNTNANWESGICSGTADITINGGNVSSCGGESSIFASGTLTINNGNISATNTFGSCISANGDITINGGNVNANADGYGIYSIDGNITISGGTVSAIGYNHAIDANYGNGSITLSGGIVTASATSTSMATALKGNVTIGNSLTYTDGTSDYTNVETSLTTLKSLKNVNVWPDVPISYIDADGNVQTCSDYIMLTNGTDISSGLGEYGTETWYVVQGNVNYNSTLKFNSLTHLILADGCSLNIGSESTPISTGDGYGIEEDGSLTIYGQNAGTGKLNINAIGHGMVANVLITIIGGCINSTTSGDYYSGIYSAGDISIINGDISATASNEEGDGIYSDSGNITVTGGTVNAIGDEYGIYAEYDFSINGGNITATGGSEGIFAAYTILAGGTVKANSYFDDGTVIIADDIKYSDGVNENPYEGILTSDNLNDIKNRTLTATMPPSYELTVNQAPDGNYWSTFYFGSLGFTIDEGVNACAYTATYGLNSETNEYELTLNKLGKDIPQGTAVIIVSSTASVSLTKNDNLGTFSGSNSLRGVDIRTLRGYIASNLGSGTFYVMGKKGDEFGFFKYTGVYMPARKAFLLIDEYNEALARGISMVFDDATGIKSIDKAQIGTASDAWYSLDGRKLLVKPTTKGVYINNGNKVIIK